ncbi:DOT5 Peroxiredoxin DOT5 [Candida maltosa Xu316]|uniref:thioredoxin-dependent peroxiredoxin n=1 Tax=Candida maltosa (strain Xu316) TaxID=1245528 RepID=M3JRD0_CANMX|nr:hypothetical protein G210_4479 [Candida maltosa Xu316]
MPELRRSKRVASKPAKEEPSIEEPSKKKTKPAVSSEKPASSGLEVGDKIPDDFAALLNQDNEEVNLPEVVKTSKYVIIFAYPKASTGGCTKQLLGFESDYAFYKDNDVTVFGLSADSPKAQKTFQEKKGAEFDLLSDPEKKLIGLLGAKKSPSGIKRSHWIFADGVLKVKEIQISPDASYEGAKKEIEKLIKGDKNGDAATKEEPEKVEDEEKAETEAEPKAEEPKEDEPKAEEEPKEEKEEAKVEDNGETKEEPKDASTEDKKESE